MNPKQRAAEAALDYLQDGMVVGLGTGSTAEYFHKALARALTDGRLRDIRGVPTSRPCERLARQLGIPLVRLADHRPDVTVDGADEVTPGLDLIKGLGGALLWEKIVAQNSARMIIIVDASKRVDRLGTRSPLPVEVVQYGHEVQVSFLRSLGAEPVLRRFEDRPFVTDEGNFIYDCRFNGIENPAALDAAIGLRAGVIDSGLFLGMAERALIGYDDRVETMSRRS
jgi:ribose 5-phosphate isomerase A